MCRAAAVERTGGRLREVPVPREQLPGAERAVAVPGPQLQVVVTAPGDEARPTVPREVRRRGLREVPVTGEESGPFEGSVTAAFPQVQLALGVAGDEVGDAVPGEVGRRGLREVRGEGRRGGGAGGRVRQGLAAVVVEVQVVLGVEVGSEQPLFVQWITRGPVEVEVRVDVARGADAGVDLLPDRLPLRGEVRGALERRDRGRRPSGSRRWRRRFRRCRSPSR